MAANSENNSMVSATATTTNYRGAWRHLYKLRGRIFLPLFSF